MATSGIVAIAILALPVVAAAATPGYAVVGRIAAGGPILAEEAIEDVFPLPRQIVGEGQLFLLKVVGDSMVDAAICDGDWVVVRQQPTADNGEIVAAMIDGEATVKTHVGHILAKTGMRDRVALVVLAYDSGAIGPG